MTNNHKKSLSWLLKNQIKTTMSYHYMWTPEWLKLIKTDNSKYWWVVLKWYSHFGKLFDCSFRRSSHAHLWSINSSNKMPIYVHKKTWIRVVVFIVAIFIMTLSWKIANAYHHMNLRDIMMSQTQKYTYVWFHLYKV